MRPYRDGVAADLDAALAVEDWGAAEACADELDRLDRHDPVPVLSAALWYASKGIPVFPIAPGGKTPTTKNGVLNASLDVDQITAWWAARPDANVGLATGHVVDVVDFDGLAAHVEWGRRYGETWAGLDIRGTVSTPRPGGMHVFVPAMPGTRNRAKMAPHVDYRGRGGYVVAPPSVLDDRPGQHPGRYRFLRPLDI